MKRISLVVLMFLTALGFAAAQIQKPATDVLGAHLNYGRGCAGCHAPHSGAYGNGAAKTADSTAGTVALWGEDVGSMFGKVITTGSTNGATGYVETLPTSITTGETITTVGGVTTVTGSTQPDVSGILMCLSCHDGNYAKGAMMKNQVYEASLLPSTYGSGTIPTLLGEDGTTLGNYLNDHPVGLAATVSCGGTHNWDCTETAGVISMTGTASSQFVTNYGFFVSLSAYKNTAVVMCTTCHNQHLMNVVSVTNGKNTGLPTGNYATMFFIRAPYNPADSNPLSNQTAQFCRQCHGGESNEMSGGTAVTIF